MPTLLRLHRSKAIYASVDATRAHLDDLEQHPADWAPPARLNRLVRVTLRTVGGWPVYRLSPRRPGARGEIVYLHGGAWIHEITRRQWLFAARMAVTTGRPMTVPIYPLAPFGHASQVVDGVADLAVALARPVSLLGDSAGGTIAVSAASALRDRGTPADRLVLVSPAFDLSFTHPELARIEPSDPWLSPAGLVLAADLWRRDLAVDDPRVSPLHGDLRGLPPVTIFSGTRDIMNADAHAFRRRATAAAVPVMLHEAPGMIHDYPLLPTPEGRRALALAAAALR
ncbi:MAG: alpha/beta hydrolase [Nakamurella sp.]